MTVFNTKYIRSLLPNRLDSRSKNESRPLDLTFTSTSVTTTLGQTKILATTSAEIARPSPSNPSEGNIIFDISFPGSLNNGIDDRQLHIAALLETALKKSKAVDVEGLCLVAGEKVWYYFDKI
jgi:exosome complex component RRP45